MDKDLNTRLTIIETQFRERWDSHDKRSEEKWDGISWELKDIKDRITDLADKQPNGFLKNSITYLWGAVGIVWAAVVVLFKKTYGG